MNEKKEKMVTIVQYDTITDYLRDIHRIYTIIPEKNSSGYTILKNGKLIKGKK